MSGAGSKRRGWGSGRGWMTAAVLASGSAGLAAAQQAGPAAMATVSTQEATVSGGLQVHGERATLLSNANVTALDHTAVLQLARGGEVRVCATSEFHLLHSGDGPSLLFGLDRGAMELHGGSSPQDVVLTPDIKVTLEHPGQYDLRLRVTRDGDTCLENAGTSAPVLLLDNAFTGATYRLIPGQHVLFEHGDLHQVVDRERSPCGCPDVAPPVPVSVAGSSAAVSSEKSAASRAAEMAAAQHPFPAAESEGLAQPKPPSNAGAVGEKNTEVSTTFSYKEGAPPPPSTLDAPPSNPVGAAATGAATVPRTASTLPTIVGASTGGSGNVGGPAAPPPAPPGAHDLAHAIGRFFHRLFHGGK